jgi:hypothetical protein
MKTRATRNIITLPDQAVNDAECEVAGGFTGKFQEW